MKGKGKKNVISDDEAIKNLLIINLLKDGVDPKLIETATGMPEKTIRNKFPMKEIRKLKGVGE
jgi:hypothetical protein